MENNRLSFSAISTYTTCGEKYRLRYKQGLRSKFFHAALAYGSAVDLSLNKLLTTKDLAEAIKEFDKTWNAQYVNKKYVTLAKFPDLVYAESDYDEELLQEEDLDVLKAELLNSENLGQDSSSSYFEKIKEKKSKIGWENVPDGEKEFYNYANWLCMRRKGHIMLESYNKKIMPQIKEVLAVQKEQYLENESGDKVVQYLDLIVEWNDGRRILMDNKTSAKDYEEDQASRSPQLISYFAGAKEEYKLDAVGFLVLKKQILKNKIKICSLCGNDGSGERHKTCASDNPDTGKRCNGTWNIKLNPECYIQVIINNVAPAAETLVLETFDEANSGIKNNVFHKNLGACKTGFQCEYFKKCWQGDNSELVDLSGEKK